MAMPPNDLAYAKKHMTTDYSKSEYGAALAAQTKRVTAVETACETLGAANALASRVRELVNDLIGPVPEACGSDPSNYGGPGVLPGLARCAEEANAAIREANEAIDRLRNAI